MFQHLLLTLLSVSSIFHTDVCATRISSCACTSTINNLRPRSFLARKSSGTLAFFSPSTISIPGEGAPTYNFAHQQQRRRQHWTLQQEATSSIYNTGTRIINTSLQTKITTNLAYVPFFQLYWANRDPNQAIVVEDTNLYFSTMPRGVKKEHLPSKICAVCNRPFTWRKKWENCWDDVTTCSKSCNRKRKEKKQSDRLILRRQELEQNETVNHVDDNVGVGVGVGVNSMMCRPQQSDTVNGKENDDSDETVYVEDLMKELNLVSDSASTTSASLSVGNEELGEIQAHNNDCNNGEHTKIHTDISSTCSDPGDNDDDPNDIEDPVARKKAIRKAEKKRKKQERREQRQGRGDKSAGQKECDMCHKSVDTLVRCTYDSSLQWKMICGKCWNVASGGVVDGDASHPYYKYGGLWKNRRRK